MSDVHPICCLVRVLCIRVQAGHGSFTWSTVGQVRLAAAICCLPGVVVLLSWAGLVRLAAAAVWDWGDLPCSVTAWTRSLLSFLLQSTHHSYRVHRAVVLNIIYCSICSNMLGLSPCVCNPQLSIDLGLIMRPPAGMSSSPLPAPLAPVSALWRLQPGYPSPPSLLSRWEQQPSNGCSAGHIFDAYCTVRRAPSKLTASCTSSVISFMSDLAPLSGVLLAGCPQPGMWPCRCSY